MSKFIPLIILSILLALISTAIYKISSPQDSSNISFEENNDDKKDAKNFSKDNEEDSLSVNFVETNIDLPDFIIPDLFESEKNFTKKDLIGKYTIINFFASWCTTCLMEHDILLRIQGEAVADLYGIAWRDINENTKKFLKKNGNPFSKVAFDSKGVFSKIADIEAVPETWLINPQGKLVLRLKGNLQDFSVDEIKRYLKLY